ncbi:Putative elongator complex protein 1 [Rhodotorula sphaerocarpa]
MRSLELVAASFDELSPATAPDNSFTTLLATTVDPATEARYAVLQINSRADAAGKEGDAAAADGGFASLESSLITHFSTPPPLPDLAATPLVVSFKYLAEDDAFALVLANGEVEQVFLDGADGRGRRENVGIFDAGIKAAAWSDDQLLTLTKTFEPLSEGPLHTASFGVDAPVSVGWGHKSTQFHGSLGKSAAAAAAKLDPLEAPQLLSPKDDGRTRIAWRGDSAWFAVNSVESAPPRDREGGGSGAEEPRRVRRIRIFSRLGEHSSTSEPLAGLEGSLAWVPSGEILASTQRRTFSRAQTDPAGQNPGATTEEEEQLQVVFFERNGLRRHDFEMRELRAQRVQVRGMRWNAASDLLALWVQRDGEAGQAEHEVQLWHRGNYHWYLKQTIAPRLSGRGELQGFEWHPEKATELDLIATDGVERYSLNWETFASRRPAPLDDGTVAVVDGNGLKLTPFRLQNVPPPMSTLVLPGTRPLPALPPAHVAFAATSTASVLLFAVVYPDSFLEVYSWTLPLKGNAQKNALAGIPTPELQLSLQLDPNAESPRAVARQCAIRAGEAGEARVAVLRTSSEGDEVLVLDGVAESRRVRRVAVFERVGKLVTATSAARVDPEDSPSDEAQFLLETLNGEILEVSADDAEDTAMPSSTLSPLPEFCPHISHVHLPTAVSLSSTIRLPSMIGLSSSGRLYSSSRLLASDATSFVVTPDFVVYTTYSHEAKFLPLTTPASGSREVDHTESFARRAGGGGGGTDSSIRRAVERGSRIVTVVPSSTTLVLQMPRGNLETICPRPLVLRVVRSHLDTRRYRSAFLLCRRHRIDLNILHDHDPAAFKAHLSDVITQIKDVDHLNLFLSGLKDEDVTRTMYRPLVPAVSDFDPTNKVNIICDLVREDLAARDLFNYANTILTAYVRKSPPAYEDALNLLVELKAKDPERAEDAVKYIIFLSDANKLFDLALGMYDFPLVLMIAQQSQKDPREYLPFLRALRALPDHVQRHRIDDHLGRHASALRHITRAGDEHFEEALEYAGKHRLFEIALQAYEGDSEKYQAILRSYAEDLFDQSKYFEAGQLFRLGGEPEKAMLAFQRAHAWQELFTLAQSTGTVDEESLKDLAVDVAEDLVGKRRHADAARVLLDYGKDVDAAVDALCEGGLHGEAIRTAVFSRRLDLIDSRVKGSALELQNRLLEDCEELREQIEKQVDRLGELKLKQEQNPYFYFCIDDPVAALENVEIAPDGMSDAGTAFTRYTANPTTAASSTRRSSKTATSRRKAALKRVAGRKGTVYEEMYLLNSIKKVVEGRHSDLQTDASKLLPVLLSLDSREHRDAAKELQATLAAFEAFLLATVDRVWTPMEAHWRYEAAEEQRIRDTGDPVSMMEWKQRPRPIEGEEETKRVERPKLPSNKWKIGMFGGLDH